MPKKFSLVNKRALKQFRKNLNSHGFTLIELLIVISIIGILSVILFVSFTQLQKNTRDQQRKNDLQTIASALQRFYNDNGEYPTETALTTPDGRGIGYNPTGCIGTGYGHYTHSTGTILGNNPAGGSLTNDLTCTPTGASSAKTYIKQMPKDPLNSGDYQYAYETTGPNDGINESKGFKLCAKMENSHDGISGVPTDCGWTGVAGSYNYQVTSND